MNHHEIAKRMNIRIGYSIIKQKKKKKKLAELLSKTHKTRKTGER